MKHKKLFRNLKILVCVILALWVINWIVEWSNSSGDKEIGLTFSPKYAQELGLDPRQTYQKMLSDLRVKYLRLPVYWDEVEAYQGVYNFTDVDWYLSEAAKRGIKVYLVLGYKQPRWPECFAPRWASKMAISDFSQQVLKLVTAEATHFKSFDNIVGWQIENEPSLPFGLCNKPDPSRLEKEIAIVRSIDPREIIVTESGELTDWTSSMSKSDLFGISIYRTVWNPWIGLVDYPLPATFYSLKNIINSSFGNHNPKETFVSELQTEAWGTNSRGLRDISRGELSRLFPSTKIQTNLDYAKKTGFRRIYLWGVEWWYMMEKLGDDSYIRSAKNIF